MLRRTRTRLLFDCKSNYRIIGQTGSCPACNLCMDAIIWAQLCVISIIKISKICPIWVHGGVCMATERELDEFLRGAEKRAFKRTYYHVRNEESALDIVQDSMMKLAEHYGHKPPAELPMLFQRILSNATLDWFRRQKTYNALFSHLSDFDGPEQDGEFDVLEALLSHSGSGEQESAQTQTERAQTLHAIEVAIQDLPLRKREAFLMRYWEELDLAETASAMGCTQGSVKTHCSRAVSALSKALRLKGIKP
jgi:RNA polymerase sigma-70 factor (ECF subfamily)